MARQHLRLVGVRATQVRPETDDHADVVSEHTIDAGRRDSGRGRRSRPKWHLLYYVVVAFDLCTVLVSLTLGHELRGLYKESVAVNQRWGQRLDEYSQLGSLAAAVNAPGNDVFDSADSSAEYRRMRSALRRFDGRVAELRTEVDAMPSGPRRSQLLSDFDRVKAENSQMVAEARRIFSYFARGRRDLAGRRMATMDRRYGDLLRAVETLRVDVGRIQRVHFEQQALTARDTAKYEYGIAVLVMFMLTGATLYGHRAGRRVREAAEVERAENERHQEELTRLAFYDTLSGLPNRALFRDRLGVALERAEPRGGAVAVLFLDLDGFKVLNDSLGHAVGDSLIAAVADRLRSFAGSSDTVARLGGDEFTILLDDVDDEQQAVAFAERVVNGLRQPFLVEGREVVTGASIGIAINGPGRESADALLRAADLAMYEAKATAKGRYHLFDPGLDARAVERFNLEADLRRALERDEFRLHYQPILGLESGAPVGVEALLRWSHPERGLVSPGEFIPVAEETGLIVPIGAWVLEHACRQVRTWRESLPEAAGLVLGVNMSARQLQHPRVVEHVEHALAKAGLQPECLKLEITESVLMEHAETATLERLKRLGVQLAIDDFGTGYSSLAYLKTFPVDDLKIDRSFVAELEHDADSASIVSSIIRLAKSLHLAVTAEGIETIEQLERLRAMDCDRAQGFHLSRPLPPEHVEAWLVEPAGRPEPAGVSLAGRAHHSSI